MIERSIYHQIMLQDDYILNQISLQLQTKPNRTYCESSDLIRAQPGHRSQRKYKCAIATARHPWDWIPSMPPHHGPNPSSAQTIISGQLNHFSYHQHSLNTCLPELYRQGQTLVVVGRFPGNGMFVNGGRGDAGVGRGSENWVALMGERIKSLTKGVIQQIC